MKVLIDLNVTLDFLQRRETFFEASASVIDAVLYGHAQGVLPAHGITTLHYFLYRGTDRQQARETVQWLLDSFEIASCDKQLLESACSLDMPDYEDAVVAMSAQRTGCAHVVTRNVSDFVDSPVPALSPTDFLKRLDRL